MGVVIGAHIALTIMRLEKEADDILKAKNLVNDRLGKSNKAFDILQHEYSEKIEELNKFKNTRFAEVTY